MVDKNCEYIEGIVTIPDHNNENIGVKNITTGDFTITQKGGYYKIKGNIGDELVVNVNSYGKTRITVTNCKTDITIKYRKWIVSVIFIVILVLFIVIISLIDHKFCKVLFNKNRIDYMFHATLLNRLRIIFWFTFCVSFILILFSFFFRMTEFIFPNILYFISGLALLCSIQSYILITTEIKKECHENISKYLYNSYSTTKNKIIRNQQNLKKKWNRMILKNNKI